MATYADRFTRRLFEDPNAVASPTQPGVVDTLAQSFAGAKTFNDLVNMANSTFGLLPGWSAVTFDTQLAVSNWTEIFNVANKRCFGIAICGPRKIATGDSSGWSTEAQLIIFTSASNRQRMQAVSILSTGGGYGDGTHHWDERFNVTVQEDGPEDTYEVFARRGDHDQARTIIIYAGEQPNINASL